MIIRIIKNVLSQIIEIVFKFDCQLKFTQAAFHIHEKSELLVFRIDRAVKAVDVYNTITCYNILKICCPIGFIGKCIEVISHTLNRKERVTLVIYDFWVDACKTEVYLLITESRKGYNFACNGGNRCSVARQLKCNFSCIDAFLQCVAACRGIHDVGCIGVLIVFVLFIYGACLKLHGNISFYFTAVDCSHAYRFVGFGFRIYPYCRLLNHIKLVIKKLIFKNKLKLTVYNLLRVGIGVIDI